MTAFEATDSYLLSMKELELMLRAADHAESALCVGLCKSCLVLLSGKFESLAESVAEEYVYAARDACARFTDIPLALRVHHSLKLLGDIQALRQHQKHGQAQGVFLQLSELWMGGKPPSTINVDCKFSYGRHGEEELRKLFNNLGVADVFSEVRVRSDEESLISLPEARTMDFRGVFNSMTNIRNNILHQDATPNLTVAQVREFCEATTRFALALDVKLRELLPTLPKVA